MSRAAKRALAKRPKWMRDCSAEKRRDLPMLDYIPAHWSGTPREIRIRNCWDRRRYRLRQVREGRWDYLRFYPPGTPRKDWHMGYGAVRRVYHREWED